MYVTPEELKELVLEAQRGTIGPRLVEVLDAIFHGVWHRYGYGLRRLGFDREDATQQCWLVLLNRLDRIDSDGNAFSYVTGAAVREFQMLVRTERNRRRTVARYADRITTTR